jgi:hypothetical protein
MRRLALIPFFIAFAACGGNNSSDTPDAPVIAVTDAAPPDAGPPDALVCTLPEMNCGDICIDTSSDELNCGGCDMPCQAGAYCDSTCMCPDAFLPGTGMGTGQFLAAQGFLLGGAPVTSTTLQVNGLVAILPDTTPAGTYNLTGPSSFPIIAAAYNATFTSSLPSADAYYVATAGSVTLDIVCAHEIKGTITDATFSGATINGTSIQVDPNGCTFMVAGDMPFDIADGTPCS